jgi:alpha-mannosidase
MRPADFILKVKNNKDKLYSNKSLLLYGNGDGGGGPLRPMLERIKRFSDISGMPADVKFGNPELFYKELEETSHDLNTWQGELYFELHRGTYTSHGLIKKYNRKCELLLREVEILWCILIAKGIAKADSYPKSELDRLWKLQLLNQFHDVLPGSSINLVYLDATKFYEDITQSGNNLKRKALEMTVEESTHSMNFFNPTCWTRYHNVIEVPSNDVSEQAAANGKSLIYGIYIYFINSFDS